MNKVVLVAENPVKWGTFVRRRGNLEPAEAKRDDAIPFFIEEGRENEDFTKEEHCAILALQPRPDDVLVGQTHGDGEVIYSRADDLEALAEFVDREYECESRLVRDFIALLGGSNLVFVDEYEETRREQSEKNRESGFEVGSEIVKGSITDSSASQKGSCSRSSTARRVSIERIHPDLVKARQMLQEHPWMEKDFGTLLEGIEKGRYHGHYENEFHQEISREASKNYRRGLEVAGKYGLVHLDAKHKVEEQLRKCEAKKIVRKYSMELP